MWWMILYKNTWLYHYSFSAQDVTGYPTLKFFKSLETSEKHRGGRDLDSLVAFIDEQMGRAPAKKEVSPFRVNSVL